LIISEKEALSLIKRVPRAISVSAFFFLFFLENSKREHVSEEPGVYKEPKSAVLAVAQVRLNASAFIYRTTVQLSVIPE